MLYSDAVQYAVK